MRKTTIPTIVILTFAFLLPATSGRVSAWDDCPKGEINDEYPGECSRYVDTDVNGICDHSEPAPEDRIGNNDLSTKQVEEQAEKSIAAVGISETDELENKKVVSLLSILVPLVVLIGYASIYKIKQNNK